MAVLLPKLLVDRQSFDRHYLLRRKDRSCGRGSEFFETSRRGLRRDVREVLYN